MDAFVELFSNDLKLIEYSFYKSTWYLLTQILYLSKTMIWIIQTRTLASEDSIVLR